MKRLVVAALPLALLLLFLPGAIDVSDARTRLAMRHDVTCKRSQAVTSSGGRSRSTYPER